MHWAQWLTNIVAIVGSCGTIGNQVIGTWVCTSVGNFMGALFYRIVCE